MVSLTSIEGDNPNPMWPNIKESDSIASSWYGVLKWFGDSIKFLIWNTHPPDEVVDVGDMLLVWFSYDYNKRTPWSFTLFGEPIGKELLDFLHNYFLFI